MAVNVEENVFGFDISVNCAAVVVEMRDGARKFCDDDSGQIFCDEPGSPKLGQGPCFAKLHDNVNEVGVLKCVVKGNNKRI